MTTPVVLTSGTTWIVPTDWSSTNTVWCIGAGGYGGTPVYNSYQGAGGGGGACAFTSNIPLVPGAKVTIQIGLGGGSTGSGTTPTANTWFNGGAIVGAGGANASANTPGAGGTTANSVGGTKYAGGAGGSCSVAAGGGGGAAGGAGTGGAGATGGGAPYYGAAGGTGDAATGGAGGAGATSDLATAGGAGTEIAGGVGAGGGGGGGMSLSSNSYADAAPGGAYGAGGGGGGDTSTYTGAAGAGQQGVIIITYTSINAGQETWPTPTTDTPSFIAHKINPHLMADRNYDDMGALWYGMSLVPLTPANIFWADGDMLPLKTEYVEANAQRYNALYGAPYTDVGALEYAAFIIPAPTPTREFYPAGVDILPLLGFVERDTRMFSLLRGQAYSDTGTEAYAAFVIKAPTPRNQFSAEGGPLPVMQYVEQKAVLRSILSQQAYTDTGALRYAASIIAATPSNQFSAEGGPLPTLGYVEAKAARFGLFFNASAFNRPPLYPSLVLIPNIFFVEGNELISDLNVVIRYVNYNLSVLGLPVTYYLTSFRDMHPNGFADTLNVLVKRFNALPPPLMITPSNMIKQFLSVGAPELTLAVNTLIDDMNVFILQLKVIQ